MQINILRAMCSGTLINSLIIQQEKDVEAVLVFHYTIMLKCIAYISY